MGPSGVSFPSFTAARENLEMVACIKLSKGGAADWKTLLLPMEGEGGGSRGSIFEVKLFKIAVRLGWAAGCGAGKRGDAAGGTAQKKLRSVRPLEEWMQGVRGGRHLSHQRRRSKCKECRQKADSRCSMTGLRSSG